MEVTIPNTQTGRSVTAEVTGTCPATRDIFVADVIATAGPFAFIASVGTNKPGSGAVNCSQAVNRDLRYGSARLGDGHAARQNVTAELRGVRVVVNGVPPRHLRMHLQQSGLRVDTVFRFFPIPSGRRVDALAGTGQQKAFHSRAMKGSAETSGSTRDRRTPEIESGRTKLRALRAGAGARRLRSRPGRSHRLPRSPVVVYPEAAVAVQRCPSPGANRSSISQAPS